MKEQEGGREKVRDHYEGHDIDMKVAVDHNEILDSPAKDSPAMTGDSKEERNYNNYEGVDSSNMD